jgi:hypothetical protein
MSPTIHAATPRNKTTSDFCRQKRISRHNAQRDRNRKTRLIRVGQKPLADTADMAILADMQKPARSVAKQGINNHDTTVTTKSG